jgi:hypothetical protein
LPIIFKNFSHLSIDFKQSHIPYNFEQSVENTFGVIILIEHYRGETDENLQEELKRDVV